MDRLWRLLRFIARSTRRLAILVAGLTVVAVGIVLIPAPGPGWLVVFAGLALLATEFTWAEILLDRAKRQAMKAKNMAVRSVNARRRPSAADGSDATDVAAFSADTATGADATGRMTIPPADGADDARIRANGGHADDFEEIANEYRSP
ncbi:MAG: TIGR02611 family protein [Acidimicrobiales bacterium]